MVDDDSWDLTDAAVLRRELGCGAALSAPGGDPFGEGTAQLVAQNFRSKVALTSPVLAEISIARSSSGSVSVDAQLRVRFAAKSVQVRLANGGSRCAGRVEIQYMGNWTTVLDAAWDLPDAAVVCRELGCGVALAAPVRAYFEEGSGPIATALLQCRGNETELRNCQSYPWGHYIVPHSNDAGVICAAPVSQPTPNPFCLAKFSEDIFYLTPRGRSKFNWVVALELWRRLMLTLEKEQVQLSARPAVNISEILV
ncbi:scavenger receptor cysteine-rich type 1 protein M130-like [Pristis pectinata]|uniref:scavenger receptor cysteine-rich type 1 protein M130-like n=1 Tax=Pristis pectinata TaxID=685728 RepID=UPI00223E6C23|nr:scavenger receptor cysteine-rich type 1 protein M130-like [Pristis pectinata]